MRTVSTILILIIFLGSMCTPRNQISDELAVTIVENQIGKPSFVSYQSFNSEYYILAFVDKDFYLLKKGFAKLWQTEFSQSFYTSNFKNFEIKKGNNDILGYMVYLEQGSAMGTAFYNVFSLKDRKFYTIEAFGFHGKYNDFTIPEDLQRDRKDILSFLESKISTSSFIEIPADEIENRKIQDEVKKTEDKSFKNDPFYQPDSIKESFVKEQSRNTILEMLRTFDRKYDFKVGFFENPVLLDRIIKISKGEFNTGLVELSNPIKIEGNILFIDGMMAHRGGDPSAAVTINLDSDLVSVGIFKDGTTYYYSENSELIPQQLLEWGKNRLKN